MSLPMLEAALRYAQAGRAIFPLRPRSKIPITENGSHDATTEEARIREWWGKWPDANIGMVLTGLVVVDIDPRNGGDLSALPGQLPDTCYAQTGGGGQHYLFRASNGTRYGAHPAPGIDVKSGPGAYIVVEPSVHPSGATYCWLDETEPWAMMPANAPSWLATVHAVPSAPATFATISEGSRNDTLASLAGTMRRRGMTQLAIEAALLAENNQKCHPPLSDEDVLRIAASISRYEPEQAARIQQDLGTTTTDGLWPSALDLEALSAREPEAPKFIMPDWLPCGYATLFAGHGGVGKSGIALHLAVCIATGRPFFGMRVEQRRVLYLSCEDRENVLHWRLGRICAHLGIGLASLKGQLEIIDLVGFDTLIWEKARDGTTLGPAWYELQARIQGYQTEVLFVDGISDTYGGNENAKTEVKRYVNCLIKLIQAERGAVILIGHIAKPTASGVPTTEGYSGTTGWHNSVRARWYLYPETETSDEGKPHKTGKLLLELQKSNLGRIDQSMNFAWDEAGHLFLGEFASQSDFDRKHQERTEQTAILKAFASCQAEAIVVPAALQGPRTAQYVLSLRPEFPDTLMGPGAAKTRRFRRHIEELRQLRYIEEKEYRRSNRHASAQLALTTEGMRQCVN